MTTRPGHRRPLGTTTRMRFVDWTSATPELGSIGYQTGAAGGDASLYRRSYRVVGVEEGDDPSRFRLVMERIAWEDALEAEATEACRVWAFYNVPR